MPRRGAAADLVGRAGARIEVAPILVQVGEDDRRVVLERVEHPIAVMRVDVDVGDALQAVRARSSSITTPQSLNTQKPAARSRAA